MNATMRSGLGLTLLVGMLAGCGSSSRSTSSAPGGGSAGTPADRQQITSELAQYPQFVDDGLYGNGEDKFAGANGPTIESALAAVQPISFSRTIRHVTTSFEFAFGDTDSTGRATTAVVTVHRDLVGRFNVQIVDDSLFASRTIRKPLHDEWLRKILLVRVGATGGKGKNRIEGHGDGHGGGDGDDDGDDDKDGDDDHHGGKGGNAGRWRIAGSSGVQVTSDSAETRIVSLRIVATGFDTTVVDPLAFFRIRRILQFARNDSVTLTATTLRNDDVVVLVHRARHLRFHNNGDNTYTGVFRAGFVLGVNHAGVNALSHGTLYDDQAPYDSQAWLFPYGVERIKMPCESDPLTAADER